MTKKLFIQALIKFTLGLFVIGLLIFIPAGSLSYINGWIFISILFIPMFIIGIVLIIKDPQLLKSRLDAKEKQKVQGIVIKLSGLMFVIGFVLAGLDFRFKWINIPSWITYVSSVVFLLGYLMYGIVLKELIYV